MTRKNISIFNLKDNIKLQARKFYLEWSKSMVKERTNTKLGEITLSRVGWRHLTRKNRKTERILQSFQLLGAAKRIIKEVIEPESFGHPSIKKENSFEIFKDYVGLRAFVTFPHRYDSAVTIVLKRQRKVSLIDGKELKRKIWFYTIYEYRRGRTKTILREIR